MKNDIDFTSVEHDLDYDMNGDVRIWNCISDSLGHLIDNEIDVGGYGLIIRHIREELG